jgi:hypothetical protein
MQLWITWLYGLWQQIPAGVRAGVSLLVAGVIATGMAFGWRWPTDWADVQAQVAAFWLVLVPVALGIFQKSIWPPLFAWLLSLIKLGVVEIPGQTALLARVD